MTDRWEQVEKLCHAALELEENRRAAFLDQACSGDEELRREVESLLKFDRHGDRFIERPAMEIAAKMIAIEKPESLVGKELGCYQIVSLLGTGGMGVVYKARDTRLNRFVAIKVLPADQVSDPERKRRFIQEARAASALNHPNIVTLHDIGSESGVDFIAMEYVEGKTLDRLIPRKGMKLNEALKIAIQMADALAKAHSAGIVHRDLKPTNVMVTEEGLVKVLDFGLAKLVERLGLNAGPAVERAQSARSTHSDSLTEEGVILGTVSYMSPEQAEGKKVDARSDIFSFGTVLYEMVSGQKAFEGDTKMSTLAAILKQEPQPLSQRVPGTPPDLEKLINRCLRKDPTRRFQTMADLKVALQELKEERDRLVEGSLPKKSSQSSALQAARSSRRVWVWAGMALVVMAIAFAAWRSRRFANITEPLPEVVPLTSYVGSERSPSFSPDGNQVAFSWNGEKQDNTDIYIKLIGSPNPVRLTTDPADDVNPVFSPDGRSIGFLRVTKDRATFIVIPSIGGPERIVSDLPYDCRGSFAWLPDGKWVVTEGLSLLSTETGETRALTSPPTKSLPDSFPAVSPDGRTVAFARSSGVEAPDLYVLNLTEDLKAKGEPRRLTSQKGAIFGTAWTSDGKEIIYSLFFFGSGSSLWRVSASDGRQPEKLAYAGNDAGLPAVSRSGNRLAYMRGADDFNIWRVALSSPGTASGLPQRFIASTRNESTPKYSPDGKRIAFESDRSGVWCIWICDADGSNAAELFSQRGAIAGEPHWSPDGQQIAFPFDADGKFDICLIGAKGGKPFRLTNDPFAGGCPNWSRDGKWVYFPSKRTGRQEVWKVPARGGGVVQVTQNGGDLPLESLDGESLYYKKGDGLWKMPVTGGEESQVLPSIFEFFLVQEGIYFTKGDSINFLSFATTRVRAVTSISGRMPTGLCVSPDGRYLLFTELDDAGTDLMLVENFR